MPASLMSRPAAVTVPKPNTGKPPVEKPKKGPLTRRCGCNALGVRCPDERWLGEELDAAQSRWLASGRTPADDDFPATYGPLLEARRAYHAHFGLRYEPERDGLWRDYVSCMEAAYQEKFDQEKFDRGEFDQERLGLA